MPSKIFVGNVLEGSDESDLKALFEVHGEVTECAIIRNYAFVHMAEESDAKAAIDALHQTSFNGEQIRCELSTKHTQGRKKAMEMEDEGFGGGRGGSGRGGGRGGGFGRGGGRGRGRGGDRFQPYSRNEFKTEREPAAATNRDPLRDPYIRDVLLRDPYVRDLIDRELYYRDILTRGDPYERDSEYPPSREQFTSRFSREAALDRDPYTRPPPDYYNRGSAGGAPKSENGLAAAVRERLAAAQPPRQMPPRPVPPPRQDRLFTSFER